MPILAVSPLNWTAPAAGGVNPGIQVTNSGNGEHIAYVVSVDVEWLTISADSGVTPLNFTITATQNDSGMSRTGEVTIAATSVAGSPKIVRVTQEAAGVDDCYEPDDNMVEAEWINVGNVFQNHTIDPSTDIDWVKFDAVEGYGYVIELANESGGDVRCQLYNANGNSVSGEINNRAQWLCPFTGTFYLKIWEYGSNNWTSYQVRVLPAYWNGTAEWDSNFEPDDNTYTSALIKTDGEIYHHENGDGADEDRVRFSAEEGRTYIFSLSNEAGGDYRFLIITDLGEHN